MDIEAGDLGFQLLAMAGLGDADGGEVLGRHVRDGGHVVARRDEVLVVLLVVELTQPRAQNFVVLGRNTTP